MRALASVGGLVIVLASLPALAQPKPAAPAAPAATVGARLDRIEAALAELQKDTASLPELQKTVGDLAAEVAALRQDVDRLGHASAGQTDLVARLDALDARVARLGEQASATRADLDSRTSPEASSTGGASFASGAWDDGFHLVDGERYSLRATGYLQLRYTLRTDEAASGGDSFPELRESGFSLRRARLAVDGHVHSPRLGYRLMAEYAGTNVRLLDYFIEGQLPHGGYLRGGQFKVPFAREFMGAESASSFVELPVATDELRYDRDLGVLAGWVGVGGRLDVSVGIFNGAGRNVSKNDNLDPLLVARVQATLLGQPWKPEEGDLPGTHDPALVMGVSGTFENAPVPSVVGYGDAVLSENASDPALRLDTDVDGDGRRDNVRVSMVGVDLAFRVRGLGVEAELYGRAEDWGAIASGQTNGLGFDPTRHYAGGFAQASYFVLPGRLQVGARYSSTGVSPLLLGGRTRDAAPEDDRRREITGLVSCYHLGHGLEATLMYSFLDWANRGGNDKAGLGEHRVILETQVAF
jgi:hypothetical protein